MPSHALADGHGFSGLTGGAGGNLDGIATATITDNDQAWGLDGSTLRWYEYDASSAAAESSPDVIIPDDNVSGTGAWLEITLGTGDALTANPLSQFAATTSAQLRGVLSDESGTGVFMTSNGDGSSLTGLQFDQFITQTAWRVFYSNGDGDVTELALGADGTYFKSNGASAAPTFDTPAGGGDVIGPASSIAESIPVFSDTGGKTLKDAGLTPTAENLIGWNSGGTALENKSSINLAFSGATPEVLLRDTDAAGADPADEDTFSIKGNLTTTTEDGEIGDFFFVPIGWGTAGTKYTAIWGDGSDAALYLGVMTDSTTPADVAGLEKIKIDFNTANDGEVTLTVPDSGYLNATNQLKHEKWSFDPDAICDGDVDRLFLFTCDGAKTFIKWTVSFEADPTTEADLDLKYADAFIGVANSAVMDVLDTTNGTSSETTAANINGGAAVADTKVVYLEFGTAYTETGHQIIFEVWYY